jgi:[methyl-Co(III) methanol-specific corrinoid protein]:coenzyme M methyltransferase
METELSSRERVLRLLRKEKVDRVPVFSGMGNVTVHGLEQYGWHFPEIHVDSRKMAATAASTFQLFGFECAVVPFDLGVEAEALGCQVNYYTDQTEILYPTISVKLAEKVEDLDIQVPSDLAKVGRIPLVVEAIRLLKEAVGDQVAIGAWVLGPYTLAGQIVELDDLTKKTLKKPEAVRNTLEALDELLISLAGIYKEAGADYLTVREMGAGEDLLSPHTFASLIQPHLERVLAGIESPRVLHICGETNNIIEQMARCGADAISVDQKNRLSESRAKVGADTILLGNINPYNVLTRGTPEDIADTVKKIIASGADAVWPGCDIWPTVPRQNMEALVTAVRQWGERLL